MIQIDVQTANRLEKGSHLRTPGNPAPPSGKQKCFKWIDSNKNRGLTDVSPKLGIPCACGLVRRESPVNGNCSGPEVRLWEVCRPDLVTPVTRRSRKPLGRIVAMSSKWLDQAPPKP